MEPSSGSVDAKYHCFADAKGWGEMPKRRHFFRNAATFEHRHGPLRCGSDADERGLRNTAMDEHRHGSNVAGSDADLLRSTRNAESQAVIGFLGKCCAVAANLRWQTGGPSMDP